MLKAYKDQKKDTLFIGASDTESLFGYENTFYNIYFNRISIPYSNIKIQYIILKDYIKLHPETKNIYFFLSPYSFIPGNIDDNIKEIENINYNFNEIYFLLFSINTTKLSIKKLYENDYNLYNFFYKNLKLLKHDKTEYFLPKKAYNYNSFFINKYPNLFQKDGKNTDNKITFVNDYDDNILYLKKIFQLFNDNNLNNYIIFTPNHAILQSIVYFDSEIYEKWNYVKKLCVENSNHVYDFNIINKYTSNEYNNINNNFIFEEFSHPNHVYGLLIFKVLHDNFYDNDNLFIKLNEKDFDKQMLKEKNLIENYIKNNNEFLERNINWQNYNTYKSEDIMQRFNIPLNNAPNYIQNELKLYEYNFQKINENIKDGKFEIGKFNNRFYTNLEN
ncbi:hypothetical protein IJG14_00025 [bacterium]|nr:hypothetical protein [bacterium]